MISESVSDILSRQQVNQTQAAGVDNNIVDKDGFLKLLIAQMQNQDPMSPLDNSEFLSQMAQFSELEQLQNINGNLTSSLEWDLAFNQTINNTMATSLIGREVEALGSELQLGASGKASLRYDLGSLAKDVRVEIVDLAGEVVFAEDVGTQDAGRYDWDWDGKNFAGVQMPEGLYRVSITALDSQGGAVPTRTYRLGTVSGVEYKGGNAFLIVDGQPMSLGDIQRISFGGASSEAGS